MSRASKVTLAATTLATAGMIYFVHWSQDADRAVCVYASLSFLSQACLSFNLTLVLLYVDRPCTPESNEMKKDNASSAKDKRILNYRDVLRRSIANSSMFLKGSRTTLIIAA